MPGTCSAHPLLFLRNSMISRPASHPMLWLCLPLAHASHCSLTPHPRLTNRVLTQQGQRASFSFPACPCCSLTRNTVPTPPLATQPLSVVPYWQGPRGGDCLGRNAVCRVPALHPTVEYREWVWSLEAVCVAGCPPAHNLQEGRNGRT